MRYSNLGDYVLGVCVTAAILAGCSGGASMPIGSRSSMGPRSVGSSSAGKNHLYVDCAGANSGSIEVFSLQAHGNATPLSVISGTNTRLDNGPAGLAVDLAGNM